MNTKQEANVVLAVLIVTILVVMSAGFFIGKKFGYRQGFNEAEAIGVAKNIRYTKDLMSLCSNDNADSYNRGAESARYECDQMVALGERVCNMSLQAAWNRGQLNGMKRIGKACGIKIKGPGDK